MEQYSLDRLPVNEIEFEMCIVWAEGIRGPIWAALCYSNITEMTMQTRT